MLRNVSESECYQQFNIVHIRDALKKTNCHAEKGPIHRKIVVDCPLVISSKVKAFSTPYKTRREE